MEPQQTPNPSPQAPYIADPTVIVPIAAVPVAVFSQTVTNKIWSKTIKRLNYATLTICAGLLLLLDLPILRSSPSLAGFFYAMVAAFSLFVGCLLFELWAGKRLQDTPPSRLDSTILVLAVMRNIIIGLNVVPLIQLIGFLAAPLALIFIFANAIMITIRLKSKPSDSVYLQS